MVSAKSLEDQLRKIHFKGGWNNSEAKELATILLPDEEIFECVNGWYEGGYALICATSIRVLLIDKKPLNFLTIEDLRFDTINQIDYNHRMFNAGICITAGMKKLEFKSYNKERLRDLISHVQHRMAEVKVVEQAHRDNNQRSLSDMDEQVKAYLLDQYDQQLSVKQQSPAPTEQLAPVISTPRLPEAGRVGTETSEASAAELYRAAIKEMFGKHNLDTGLNPVENNNPSPISRVVADTNNIEVNPLKVAYGKLPMILRSRRQSMTYEPTAW